MEHEVSKKSQVRYATRDDIQHDYDHEGLSTIEYTVQTIVSFAVDFGKVRFQILVGAV